jgi:cytochrome c
MSLPQSRNRSLSTLVLLSAVLGAAAFGVASPSVARAADEACTTKKFNYPAVEKACKDGGRKAAKDVMKAALKKAKAAGNDVKCTSCHEDTKAFKLKDNAVKDLKPWI